MFQMISRLRCGEFGKIALPALLVLIVSSYILLVGGCDANNNKVTREEEESHFIRGREELRRGNDKEALNAFLKVTEKRRDAPESHLNIGLIYLNSLNDPIPAIYHFRKFLEAKPNADYSESVRQHIDTAQKRFAGSLPGNPRDINLQNVNFEEVIRSLKAENLELKQQLANANSKVSSLERSQIISVSQQQSMPSPQQRAASAQGVAESQPARQATPPVVAQDVQKSYTVLVGDTLSSISRKVYGTSNKWRDIFNANRDIMSTPQSLKPGQVLKIPPAS